MKDVDDGSRKQSDALSDSEIYTDASCPFPSPQRATLIPYTLLISLTIQDVVGGADTEHAGADLLQMVRACLLVPGAIVELGLG